MLKPIFLIAFTGAVLGTAVFGTAVSGQVLCAGNGPAVEKDGILAALQQIGKILPQSDADAKLVSIDLLSYGVCQYEMLSPDGGKRLIFINGPVTMQLSSKIAAAGTERPLPENGLVDLPQAIAAAQREGLRLPLDSARLRMAQPRGKPAVAVWTLSPKKDPQGRVLSYFISAADAGRPLKLSDVTDYVNNYNAQWQHIVDMFHSAQQGASGTQQQSNSLIGQPCIMKYMIRGNPQRGIPASTMGTRRGEWTQMTNGLACW